MKNFKKLSREEKKGISAGAPPAFCFEGDGPGTGAAEPTRYVPAENVYLIHRIPVAVVREIPVVVPIPVSARGEPWCRRLHVLNFIVLQDNF
uniref:Uncharacterized protein n=1 Tax=Chryseobacterium endophyticum TaxID=1854762 RepID=A0AAU6WRL4_9FLAO